MNNNSYAFYNRWIKMDQTISDNIVCRADAAEYNR